MRRIAFFFSIRRVSLFETNQRLRRTVLKTPLFTTFLRKRLSKESWDSPFRKFTTATVFTSFPFGNKNRLYAESAEGIHQKPETNSMTVRSITTLQLSLISTCECKIHNWNCERDYTWEKPACTGILKPVIALPLPEIWAEVGTIKPIWRISSRKSKQIRVINKI